MKQKSASVVNRTITPSKGDHADFIEQCEFISLSVASYFSNRRAHHMFATADLFLSQNNNLDPEHTVYATMFGIKCVSGFFLRLQSD